MKTKRIRIISLILVLSMTVLTHFIASCGEKTNSTAVNETSAAGNDTPGGDGSDNTATTADIPFPYEPIDLKGANFKILIDRQWSGNSLDVTDYDIEEMNGEVLNDAIYNRNLIIQDMYNLKFVPIHAEDTIETMMSKAMKAAIDEYDAVAVRLLRAAIFASKGFAVNVFDTSLTLDAPWWDQNIIKDTSIGGAAYFFAGDIFIKHYDGIDMLMFNKKLLNEFGLESPYNLVNSNQWTMDKFNELVKADGIKLDLDNNDKMNRYDRYGFVTQIDYLPSFVIACGEKFVSKDGNDMPYFTGNTEKASNIIDKMLEVYVDYTYDMHRDAYGRDSGSGQLVQFWVFPEGRGLFYWGFPRYMELGLRDMEDDYGIVPIPKWDSSQDRYYAMVNNWHSYTYVLPRTVGDVDKNSQVLDAMAYYGMKLIKPAYYEVCLQRKYSRDEESSAMLDIIFSSTCYDIGSVYGVGGYIDALCDNLQKGNNTVMTSYEKLQGKIEKDINKLIEQFENAKQ